MLIQRFGQFWFLQKCRRLASPPNPVYDFPRKVFFILYSINWPNFIAWLPLFLEVLGNMCIDIICCPVCDVINFENNHSFHIKSFFHPTKNSGQECKYLQMKQKTHSINFRDFKRPLLKQKIKKKLFWMVRVWL